MQRLQLRALQSWMQSTVENLESHWRAVRSRDCSCCCCSHLEVSRHFVHKFLCVLCHLIVQINGCGVLQETVLPVYRCNHFWVAMANTDCYNTSKSLQGGSSRAPDLLPPQPTWHLTLSK
eukprot:GHRR01006737.1.p1 GENE.GHRR01006737.1~~GHRR01006737.1.p1  ORF type:complete len:120 (+),score=23.75 GHRR01006737.1:40-399(+)